MAEYSSPFTERSYEQWEKWGQSWQECDMSRDEYLLWIGVCAVATQKPDSCFVAVKAFEEKDDRVFVPISLRVDHQDILPVNQERQKYIWVTDISRFKSLAKQFIKGELQMVEPKNFGEDDGDEIVDLYANNISELAGRIQALQIGDEAIHPRLKPRY